MKSVLLLLTLLLISSSLQAVQTTKESDSVRKAIDRFGKMSDKEVSEVDKLKKVFKEGKGSAQLKLMYSTAPDVSESYATAIGGILKYELAAYHGFNAAVATYISYDMPFASGDGLRRSSELSSSQGNYVDVAEAYVNYKRDAFRMRLGRQTLDTPLADADDIRMIQNSFEAYTVGYTLYGIEFLLGNLQEWSGYDAGLDNGWVKTGEDGVNFGGVAYDENLQFNAWYYNITGLTNALYIDLGYDFEFSKDIHMRCIGQYLQESELANSGIKAKIYGFLADFYYQEFELYFALNMSERFEQKESFSGFGGGALFTSMDTTILDNITSDREAVAFVGGISYGFNNTKVLYAYGDFFGQANSSAEKAHIVEQNLGIGYDLNEEFVIGFLYAMQDDLVQVNNNWSRAQFLLYYNFK